MCVFLRVYISPIPFNNIQQFTRSWTFKGPFLISSGHENNIQRNDSPVFRGSEDWKDQSDDWRSEKVLSHSPRYWHQTLLKRAKYLRYLVMLFHSLSYWHQTLSKWAKHLRYLLMFTCVLSTPNYSVKRYMFMNA